MGFEEAAEVAAAGVAEIFGDLFDREVGGAEKLFDGRDGVAVDELLGRKASAVGDDGREVFGGDTEALGEVGDLAAAWGGNDGVHELVKQAAAMFWLGGVDAEVAHDTVENLHKERAQQGEHNLVAADIVVVVHLLLEHLHILQAVGVLVVIGKGIDGVVGDMAEER